MDIKKKNHNVNNFNGSINFNGPAQIATGDIINNYDFDSSPQKAIYKPEPIWRSPFTLAVLTWISVAIGVAGLFPFGGIVKFSVDLFSGNLEKSVYPIIQICMISLIVLAVLFAITFSLGIIAKKQTRHPLFFNYAINGFGEHLTLEKIHIDKCPQCGGKMKYYNKPVEWREILYTDGTVKREVTKKVPALECKRNAKHYYEIDPAEDKVSDKNEK